MGVSGEALQLHAVRKKHTLDREIFAVKKFLPVAWVAKIKRTKITYMYMRFIAEPSGDKN